MLCVSFELFIERYEIYIKCTKCTISSITQSKDNNRLITLHNEIPSSLCLCKCKSTMQTDINIKQKDISDISFTKHIFIVLIICCPFFFISASKVTKFTQHYISGKMKVLGVGSWTKWTKKGQLHQRMS